VLDYKCKADENREALLAELVVLGQELDSED
jgi:hypothetical protein